MEYFNQYQYNDLLARSFDPYANVKYALIRGYLRGEASLRILNAGCGSGELSFLLAADGHTVMGIDPAEEYIALAKQALPQALASRCFFQVGTIEEFESARPFDAVVATDVLEHIEDDARAAQRLSALVKDGGKLIVTVPALPSLFGFHDEQLGHFRRYRVSSLRALLAKTRSLEVLHLRYFGWTLIPICLLWSKILRRPYPMAKADNARSFVGRVLHLLLYCDTHIPLPLGTSLIFLGKKV